MSLFGQVFLFDELIGFHDKTMEINAQKCVLISFITHFFRRQNRTDP